jgi:2,3-bisphosphoglycerate-dependent phosphoglycerate mutase
MLQRLYLKPTKNCFLMIRHGESVWNKDSKFTGWTNIPLTNNGKKEAEIIAQTLMKNHLYPNIIFTSVLDRSIDTSNIIKKVLNENNENNENDIKIHTSWRLNEKHYGTLEGIPRKYVRDKYGVMFTKLMRSDFTMKPPVVKDYQYNSFYPVYKNCYLEKVKNGESKENVLNRLIPYYENDILYTLSENKFPLIVTHKHTARVLMKHLLKIDEEDFEHYELPSKKILLIHLKDDLSYDNHDEIVY